MARRNTKVKGPLAAEKLPPYGSPIAGNLPRKQERMKVESLAASHSKATRVTVGSGPTNQLGSNRPNVLNESLAPIVPDGISALSRPSQLKNIQITSSSRSSSDKGAVNRSRSSKNASQSRNRKATTDESKSKDDDERERFFLLAIVGILLLGGFFLMVTSNHEAGQSLRVLSKAEEAQRIEFHKQLTGATLNRQRIGVEYDNYMSAPALPLTAQKIKQPTGLEGIPLQMERNTRDRSDEHPIPVDPDYADARVQYSLQEEQDASEWQARAQKEYVNDFVANAAKAGYKVQVNKNLDVQVSRMPNALPSQGGMASPPDKQSTGPSAASGIR